MVTTAMALLLVVVVATGLQFSTGLRLLLEKCAGLVPLRP